MCIETQRLPLNTIADYLNVILSNIKMMEKSLLAAFNIESHTNPALPWGRVDAYAPGVHGRQQVVDNSCVGVTVPSKYLKQSNNF